MAISLFTARSLTAKVNVIHPVDNFLVQTFFGKEVPSDTKYVEIKVTKGGKDIAPFVSPRLEGKVLKQSGQKLEVYEPPLQKPKFMTIAEDLLENNSAHYANGATPEERAAEQLITDLDDGKGRIYRRTELMAAQALETSKIIVKGEGVEDEIDFGRKSSHTKVLTGTALWTDSSSDPLANLEKWQGEVLDESGVDPDICVMGRDAGNAFKKHPKVLEMFDKKDISIGELKPEKKMKGVTYLGYIKELDLQVYKYVGKYKHPETSVNTLYWPADKIVIGASHEQTDAHVAFGGIADMKTFRKEGMDVNLFVGQIFVKSWEVEDPSGRYLMFQSKPLPIPGNVDASMCAKVV